jgi:hypothetical protein
MKKNIVILILIIFYIMSNHLVGGCGQSSQEMVYLKELRTGIDGGTLTSAEISSGDMDALLRVLELARVEEEKVAELLHTVLQEGHLKPCCHLLEAYARIFGSADLIKRLLGITEDPKEDLFPALYEGIVGKSDRNHKADRPSLTFEAVADSVHGLEVGQLIAKRDGYRAKIGSDFECVSMLESGIPSKRDIEEMKSVAFHKLKNLIRAGNTGTKKEVQDIWEMIPNNPVTQVLVISGVILNLENPAGFETLISLLPEERREQVAINVIAAEGMAEVNAKLIDQARQFILVHSKDPVLIGYAIESSPKGKKRTFEKFFSIMRRGECFVEARPRHL